MVATIRKRAREEVTWMLCICYLKFWELTFWEVDNLGVDISGADILGVDILRLARL